MGLAKKAMFLAAITLTVMTIVFGKEVLDFYRFAKAVKPHEKAAKLEGHHTLTDTCINCHGFGGNSQSSEYPYLAGLSEKYLFKTLQDFQSGNRYNPIMSPLAKQLTRDEISMLSQYYAAKEQVNRFAKKSKSIPESQDMSLSLSECQACHGADLQGGSDLVGPKIAGQGQTYIEKQLFAYKNGKRRDSSGAMNALMRSKSAQQIQEIARVVSATK